MKLTEEQISVLEDNDWCIVCESPFEMEFCSQFCGTTICKSVKEAKKIYNDIIKHKKIMKSLEEHKEKTKRENSEKDIKEFKGKVKDLLVTGITEDTLLEFYMVSCWYGKKNGNSVTSNELKNMFKEVFDEVDP